MNQTNINKNRNINNNNNNNNEHANIVPIYNPNNLKIDSNNALLNIHAEVNINANKEKENLKKNIQSNENKNRNNENANANSGNFNNFNNIKENRNEESKKSNQRSQSTGIVNPLQKSHDKEEIKEQKLNKEIPVKEKEIPIKEKEIPIKENIKVRKIIRDILPYTHVGFDGEEPKENNQDNYFIYKNFMKKKDYIYMSVCDGHGAEGHFVSDFIKETLPYDMSENLKNMNILTENEKEKNKIYQIITETFIIANEKLVENEEINSLFSGSTCVSVIYTPEKLIVPNIGDSRAVLGRLINKENNEYKAINLSRDHKPTEKDEAQRIIENDGRIQPFTEEGEFVGPERVWIKEEDVPGLAMTRSFGDRVAATVGVMSEPEIKEFDFDENDKFMIIASDGIWEFISSQECVDIIKNFYDKNELKECCEYLYQESSKRWLKEEEVIDDTTLILVFFE
jgi:serine/threonine protein phosphatase PrpC